MPSQPGWLYWGRGGGGEAGQRDRGVRERMSMCVHITHVSKTDRVMCAYACVHACARGN